MAETPPIADPDPTRTGLRRLSLFLVLFTAATVVFILWDLDLAIQEKFYSDTEGWYLKYEQPWLFLYQYGTIPGLVLTIGALIGGFFSLILPRFRMYHRYMLLIFLTSLIGAGLLVNAIFKPYMGRPRPRQIIEFSGQWEFHHPFQPGIPGKGQSFPSGHCTMGFLFCTLFFVRKRSRAVAIWGGGFGLVYGSFMGMARMVQGAHFPTDVIWSLGVIALVATTLHYFVIPRLAAAVEIARDFSGVQKCVWAALAIVLTIAVTVLFLTRRPFYEAYWRPLTLHEQVKHLVIESEMDIEGLDVTFVHRHEPRITIHVQGFGWINAFHDIDFQKHADDSTLRIICRARSRGYFSELSYRAEVSLPEALRGKIAVHMDTRHHRSLDPSRSGPPL